MEGWISLHRQLVENSIWTCEKFSKGQAWVDLILIANHKDSFFFKRGVRVDVKRGQVGVSELGMSERWRWSRSKVRNFLKELEKEQQIKIAKTNVTQIVTLVNYDLYNKKEQQKDTRRTPKGHQKDTYKNDKKENNDKIEYREFVFLTEIERQKLVDDYGEDQVEKMFDKLNNYKGSNGKKYKSDYLAILSWVVKDFTKHGERKLQR